LRLLGLRRGGDRDRFRDRYGRESAAHALTLGIVIVAAGKISDSLVRVAAGDSIGAREVAHAVGQVGVGVEKAVRGARVAERSRRGVLDLHEPEGSTPTDRPGVVAALADDDAVHQGRRDVVDFGVLDDQRLQVEPRFQVQGRGRLHQPG
jgi:hypothetical protein